MTDEDKALVKQAAHRAAILHASAAWGSDEDGALINLLIARIEAQAAEIEKLREALHTPLAFIEALHENDPDDQIADNGMTVLVERLQERADEIPQEQADLENEARGHCGPYGTDTADDYLDDYDRLLMLEAKDRIEQLEADVARLREALKHQGGPLCMARYHPTAECTCGVSAALGETK